jgi:hypothetical protein
MEGKKRKMRVVEGTYLYSKWVTLGWHRLCVLVYSGHHLDTIQRK